MFYLANVKLVSEIVNESVPGAWLDGYDDVTAFMNNHYFSSGGSYVVVNPESIDELPNGPFRELEYDLEDEPILEEIYDGFEIVGEEKLGNGDVEISYRLTPGVEIRVEADSEEEARSLCMDSLLDILDIVDAAVYEAIGTEKIIVNYLHSEEN